MKTSQENSPLSIVTEFNGAELGDARRQKRLWQIASLVQQEPQRSLPQALGTVADQEATYRFLNNSAVSFGALLEPHFKATRQRLQPHEKVLVLHDTTQFCFDTPQGRRGLGRLRGETSPPGFYTHASLAVTSDETHEPLGLLAVQPWTRTPQVRKMRRQSGQDEMQCWMEGARRAEKQAQRALIHIMDRQGDSYALYAGLMQENMRFVIRGCHNRLLEDGQKLFETVAQTELRVSREVRLTQRKPRKTLAAKRIFPKRNARVAQLSIRAAATNIARSGWITKTRLPATLPMNVVQVLEESPPQGESAVLWYLLTSEPIDNPEQILQVVDHYRARWQVEEYFKAIKTGCRYESLQLESYDALLRMLAIYMPVAWQLLRLRSLDRASPEAPATTVLTATQIRILRTLSARPFPSQPTVHDVLLALAAKGGHIRNNGPPGWLVLARGLQDLLMIEVGWNAAFSQQM